MENRELLERYRGCDIYAYYSCEEIDDPRIWDNLGTMICKHSRYSLGDTESSESYVRRGYSVEHDMASYFFDNHYPGKFEDTDEFFNEDGELSDKAVNVMLDWMEENVVVLPLFLYDHSGLRISTSATCQWDSGQIGFIYATKGKILSWYGLDECPDDWKDKAIKQLLLEVSTYDSYVSGDVQHIEFVYPDGEAELVGTVFGSDSVDDMIVEAQSRIDAYWQWIYKQWFSKLKTYIRYRVPFSVRGNEKTKLVGGE